MKTVYVLMFGDQVLGVYGHPQTAKAHIKKYEHLGNLDLYTIHPENKNVLFDLNDHFDINDCDFVEDEAE